ncbi:MAG: hypothetical protein KKG00_00480 [Bacteroidetes bacterium]|nr:hypothetical protein [Bacteroidota bacterium]
MHHIYYLSLLFALFFFDLSAQTLTKRTYEGTISHTIPITITLTQDGQSISGTVVYKKKGVPIAVVGKVEEGNLFLHELLKDGSVTGIYSLSPKGTGWAGSWTAPGPYAKDREITLKESSKATVPVSKLANVTGTYAYSFGKEAGSGEVLVQQVSPGKITVAVNAVTGGPAYNIATIEKTTLTLRGNRAVYETHDFGTCKIQFTFGTGTVQVDYLDGAYGCGFGHNASAVGNYIRTSTGKPLF